MDPDYGSLLVRETNVLRGRVESAREYLRQKAAPRRIFGLVWQRRPQADWLALENFRHKMLTDFFTYHDKESGLGAFTGRKFSVMFHEEPTYARVGFEQIDMRAAVIEQVGAAMAEYPVFTEANYPFVNSPVAQAETVGSDKLWVYAGYGYRVNGSFTSTFLDEISQGSTNPVTSVALGLHRVRVTGGPPTSLDFLI